LIDGQGLEFSDLPPDSIAAKLNRLLTEAREKKARQDELRRKMTECEENMAEASRDIESLDGQLAQMRRKAGVDSDDELEGAERASKEYREARQELARIEDDILASGGGKSLSYLEKEAEDVNPDDLPGRIDDLETSIDRIQKKRDEDLPKKGALEKEIQSTDETGVAAEAAERAESILAGMRMNVEHYMRLRMASQILGREIERYRRENQEPLLVRAGEIFSRLTLGAFQTLRTDSKDDAPHLVCVRDSGEEVEVHGLSSGTRDQLFLALRLATVENHVRDSEPMPLVVDDVLINFDDDRSRATLDVLTELAQRTQVLLFTHHSRIAEFARDMGAEAGVFVHDLD